MAALTITGKPTGFYSRMCTREWPFIRELKYEVVMLPRWLVSTPIRTYAHPATPSSIPLDVDTASSMQDPWGLAQVHAPPQNRTWKVQRPPMVVGGGLEEDVCEVKDTAKQKRGWVPSRSLDSRRTGPAGSLYQAVQVMIYPWWSCQCRKGAMMGPHCWIVLPMS